jgi:hypothetical protein
MFLDFFQRLTFRLRQAERGGDEIDDGATGEDEEHRGAAVLANAWQKAGGDGVGDGLVALTVLEMVMFCQPLRMV